MKVSQEHYKQLVMLAKERGFLSRSEIRTHLQMARDAEFSPPDYSYPKKTRTDFAGLTRIQVDDEMIDSIAETFADMGIQVSA